ncbi:MAG: ParB N-terminal domain-containing protein [Clostridiales Family XIII bacterium]|jgi:ParB family chromosome partitioning protein|nr:ParB N-terminal domain-containing protein [Clostridiales Family XIII bacterium]
MGRRKKDAAVTEAESKEERTAGIVPDAGARVNFKFLDTAFIAPHPNNPRIDLGDLSELTDSIRAKGVLQNLTVAPLREDDPFFDVVSKEFPEAEYVCVIGHRRLAAAKLASFGKVPCIVADMAFREQAETMLLENMARKDLTLYEQAQGFQLMMELDFSVSDIVSRTGFSETTVRSRIELAKLDGDGFRKAVCNGATLSDFAELAKLRSTERRNKVLKDAAGTVNFRWLLNQEIYDEKAEDNMPAMIGALKRFASETNDTTGLSLVRAYRPAEEPAADVVRPKDADEVEYFFCRSGRMIHLLRKRHLGSEGVSGNGAEKADAGLDKRKAALAEVFDRARGLRLDFARGVTNAAAKKKLPEFLGIAARIMYEDFDPSWDDFFEFLGIDDSVKALDGESAFDYVMRESGANEERFLFALAYACVESKYNTVYDWAGRYNSYVGENLLDAHKLLGALGYEPSDDERALADGTHELYAEE